MEKAKAVNGERGGKGQEKCRPGLELKKTSCSMNQTNEKSVKRELNIREDRKSGVEVHYISLTTENEKPLWFSMQCVSREVD